MRRAPGAGRAARASPPLRPPSRSLMAAEKPSASGAGRAHPSRCRSRNPSAPPGRRRRAEGRASRRSSGPGGEHRLAAGIDAAVSSQAPATSSVTSRAGPGCRRRVSTTRTASSPPGSAPRDRDGWGGGTAQHDHISAPTRRSSRTRREGAQPRPPSRSRRGRDGIEGETVASDRAPGAVAGAERHQQAGARTDRSRTKEQVPRLQPR